MVNCLFMSITFNTLSKSGVGLLQIFMIDSRLFIVNVKSTSIHNKQSHFLQQLALICLLKSAILNIFIDSSSITVNIRFSSLCSWWYFVRTLINFNPLTKVRNTAGFLSILIPLQFIVQVNSIHGK